MREGWWLHSENLIIYSRPRQFAIIPNWFLRNEINTLNCSDTKKNILFGYNGAVNQLHEENNSSNSNENDMESRKNVPALAAAFIGDKIGHWTNMCRVTQKVASHHLNTHTFSRFDVRYHHHRTNSFYLNIKNNIIRGDCYMPFRR